MSANLSNPDVSMTDITWVYGGDGLWSTSDRTFQLEVTGLHTGWPSLRLHTKAGWVDLGHHADEYDGIDFTTLRVLGLKPGAVLRELFEDLPDKPVNKALLFQLERFWTDYLDKTPTDDRDALRLLWAQHGEWTLTPTVKRELFAWLSAYGKQRLGDQ